MMTISFCVNVLVLGLVVPQIWGNAAGMSAAFGTDTVARQILTCVYAAIWIASVVGLGMIAFGRVETAVTLAIGLFAVQIMYKLMTVWAVGLANPVVMANLPIAIFHSATLVLIVTRA